MYSEREEAARLGRQGENIAAEYFRKNGYIIVKRNWRDSRYGEIDIVAENNENIVFVEVRTRRLGAMVSGAESISDAKLGRVKIAAQMFMARFNTDLPYRVDVIELTAQKTEDKYKWKLKHIKNV